MKYRSFLFPIIVVLILCGCSGRKQAEPVQILRHRTVDIEDQYLGYGGFLAYCQGVVTGIEMNRSLQPFFCLKPDDPSHTFFFFGHRGRGANEFLMPYSIQSIDNRTVGIFDAMSSTYYEFTVPNDGETPKTEREVHIQSPLTRIIKTAFGRYIGLSSLDEKMFSLIDSTGVRVNTFFEYPHQDATERKDMSRGMAYQGTLAVNPSKTKFVYSSFYGEIIHFYSIEENSIEAISKTENTYPVYRHNNDGSRGVSYGGKGIDGYIATYATEKFVYAIYSGETIVERHEEKRSNFEGNILRVFDWNGVLVKEYGLDVPCSYLCVSDDDSTVWAIATISDQIGLVSFQFGNQADERRVEKAPEIQLPPPGTPAVGTMFSIEVRTKDNRQNDETQKVLDSIKSLRHATLDLRPTDRYDVQMETDTINNIVKTVLILK